MTTNRSLAPGCTRGFPKSLATLWPWSEKEGHPEAPYELFRVHVIGKADLLVYFSDNKCDIILLHHFAAKAFHL